MTEDHLSVLPPPDFGDDDDDDDDHDVIVTSNHIDSNGTADDVNESIPVSTSTASVSSSVAPTTPAVGANGVIRRSDFTSDEMYGLRMKEVLIQKGRKTQVCARRSLSCFGSNCLLVSFMCSLLVTVMVMVMMA